MGASQAHAHAREPTVPLLPPPAPPPPHVDLSAALLTTSPPLPSLPTHLQLYIDWLFSLPPSSASHFACYLLHLTQSVVLPPVPTPPLVDLIAAPPIESYPPNVVWSAPPKAPMDVVYCTLSREETSMALLSVLHSRHRTALCIAMMRNGPLLAACRIAQSLLTVLALPLSTPLTSSALSPLPSTAALPLHLLRSHQLCHALRPLVARIDWSLSAAALSDEQSVAAAYYLHDVTVTQLRRLRSDVLRLLELMREDESWTRQQKRAVLVGVWRGQHGRSGGGGSLGVFAADRLFDVQLVREVFSYVWE